MRRSNSTSVATENRAPGAFMPDGSWNEDAGLHHRGHVHRLVAALVRERGSRLSPQRAAQTIQAANAVVAFPNVGQWADCESWTLVRTSTAAEDAIKREGRGIAGHWCGERWLDGSERECPEPRHRTVARPGQLAETIRVIEGALDSAGTPAGCGGNESEDGGDS